MKKDVNSLDKLINGVLFWFGSIGAIVFSIGYLALMMLFVVGLQMEENVVNFAVMSVVNAVMGLCIANMLKIQGAAFGDSDETSMRLDQEYRELLGKSTDKKHTKKMHTMRWFWFWSLVQDIAVKGVLVGASSYVVYSVMIVGNGQWQMVGMALVNLLLFISFGLLSLRKAYNYRLNKHNVWLENHINELKRSIASRDTNPTQKEVKNGD